MINGIYDFLDPTNPAVRGLIDRMRLPTAVNVSLLLAVGVALLPQRSVRPFLLWASLLILAVFMGVAFAAGVFGAGLFAFWLARSLAAWGRRRRSPRLPLAVGWLLVNALYLPCFLLVLPFIPGMEAGELTQFCGVGFLTLKALHYLGRSCRGQLEPGDCGLGTFLLYLVHLPTFRLGPYQGFADFNRELDTCKQRLSWPNAARGLWRIALGTGKMLLLYYLVEKPFFKPYENNIPFAAGFFDGAGTLPAGQCWLMAYLLFIRAYLFLSGLTDGAVGANLLMGIRTPENFHRPLLATNVAEFWRRWHMSLGSWLREEIYIPLGGNRKRQNVNVLAVFVYCGLWHFAFFWGGLLFALLNGGAIMAASAWMRLRRRRHERASRLHAAALRLGLVDSVASRLVGRLIVFHLLSLTTVVILDHEHSGLPMLARMFGLR